MKSSAPIRTARPARSLPVRGAWIEMPCRKSRLFCWRSLPVRGAWIEMGTATCGNGEKARRSPCGERGLKSEKPPTLDAVTSSRSPCGERGLKYTFGLVRCRETVSLPVRGAWIEIMTYSCDCSYSESLPVRGAWIEILPVSPSSPTVSCRSPCGERGLKLPYVI